MNKKCYGVNLKDTDFKRAEKFDVSYLFEADKLLKGQLFESKKKIFNLLAGNDVLWRQVMLETSEEEIRKTWEPKLGEFKQIRKKYLLYD
jgi:uncharacterized protein YbbC (DUF1343 family)